MSAADCVDADGIRRFAAELVATPSVNPDFECPDRWTGEGNAARLVARELEAAGLEVKLVDHGGGRTSVLGTLEGSGPGRRIMLNGHLDTVPPGGDRASFEPLVEEGRLYGRGAFDMKGAVAACVGAVRALARSGIHFPGTVQVSAVADEEVTSIGTGAILELGVPDAAIVTEPSALIPCTAHRGFAWIAARTRGRAAHGSMPDKGKDANRMMGLVLARIEEIARALEASEPHPVVGRGSLHIGRLSGGGAWSVYADRCTLGVERRTVPGETGTALAAELQAAVRDLAARHPGFEGEVELVLDRPPFAADAASPLMSAVAATGLARGSGAHAVPFWTDAALFAAAGADTIVLGPDGAGAHAAEEWVDLDSIVTLARLLADACTRYLTASDTTMGRTT